MFWFHRILVSSNEKIAIIGLGKEHQQFIDWLITIVQISPSRLILADAKQPTPSLQELLHKYSDIETYFGENYLSCLENPLLGWVFKTPGMWSKKPEFELFRQQKGEDRIHSNLIFFLEACKTNVIGITGTKGKTTTSSLIYHILNEFHLSEPTLFAEAVYCGNSTNISPYQFWLNKQQPPLNTQFILELSSFQLQDLNAAQYSPHISVVTNYFVDHLDQHANIAEYWGVKDTILRYQTASDVAVITDQIRGKTTIDLLYKNVVVIDQAKAEYLLESILSSHLPLLGQHNQKNAAQAVYAVASALSKNITDPQSFEDIILAYSYQFKKAIESFNGVAHRLQLVHEIHKQQDEKNISIRFWDDGAATEPDAVMAAINSLTPTHANSWLILHVTGVDKGSSLAELIDLMKQKIATGSLYGWFGTGEIGNIVRSDITIESLNAADNSFRSTVKNVYPTVLNTIFLEALNQGITEINILFSPSGSSFDEFTSYTERSNWWISNVKNIVL